MADVLKRRLILGSIEPDFDNQAIVVHYQIESISLVNGKEVVERTAQQKVLKVTGLDDDTDIPALAQQLASNEKLKKLIPPQRIPLVEKQLYLLQQRARQQALVVPRRVPAQRTPKQPAKIVAHMSQLESYMEELYADDVPRKIQATAQIAKLAEDVGNLEQLLQSEALLSALSRMLREEHEKNLELTTNILHVFMSFSNFSQFHPVLTQNTVGDNCMRIITYELSRYELWEKEGKLTTPKGGLNPLVQNQEQLLEVCFMILLNLAEDVGIERKMQNRGIIRMLVSMLNRTSTGLVVVAVTFLKKLSIFQANRREMKELHIVERLSKFVPTAEHGLLELVLRLYFNLSFEPEIRDQMVKSGLIAKFVGLLRQPEFRSIIIKLLFHLSMDDRCKSMFTYTDAIGMVLKMILEWPTEKVAPELMALAINLVSNKKNAEIMCEDGNLHLLMKRATRHWDSLLMKMIRAISQHDGPLKDELSGYIRDYLNIMSKAKNPDFQVEILGTLANLNMEKYNWSRIIEEYRLIPFFESTLQAASTEVSAEDDVLINTIMFIGTVVSDPKSGPLLAKSNIINLLIEIMAKKQSDDDIVLQVIYTFYKLMQAPETRAILLTKQQLTSYLTNLLYDENTEIRRVSDLVLDAIMESDRELAKQIRKRKFELYNMTWLQAICQEEDAMRAHQGRLDTEPSHPDEEDDDTTYFTANENWNTRNSRSPASSRAHSLLSNAHWSVSDFL